MVVRYVLLGVQALSAPSVYDLSLSPQLKMHVLDVILPLKDVYSVKLELLTLNV